MELRHLRHFLAVAEELHMGRAAQRLGMAQPPLSQSIARLETELGVRLFDRANRRLTLTPAGAVFLGEARASVRHADAALAAARAAERGTAGVVRIGFDSAALYHPLPKRLARLREVLPDVQAKLFEASTNDQLDALKRGALDIGFAHPPFGAGDPLVVHDLPADVTIAALPDDGRSGDVGLAEIAALGLILFPADQGPVLHAAILDVFARAGLEGRVVQEARRALTMLSMVSAGLGVALLPKSIRRLSFQGVRYAEIVGAPLPAWPLAMIALRRPQPPVVRQVLRIFSENASPSLA